MLPLLCWNYTLQSSSWYGVYYFRHQWSATSMVFFVGAKLAVRELLPSFTFNDARSNLFCLRLFYVFLISSNIHCLRKNNWRHCSWYNVCLGSMLCAPASFSIHWIYIIPGLICLPTFNEKKDEIVRWFYEGCLAYPIFSWHRSELAPSSSWNHCIIISRLPLVEF